MVYFIEQMKGWQNKLNVADSVISIWMEVQCTWAHLESIFIFSDDIRSHLPEDVHRLNEINTGFRVSKVCYVHLCLVFKLYRVIE